VLKTASSYKYLYFIVKFNRIMTIIKDADKLCTIVNSEAEFRESIQEGRTLAFILQDNVECCTSLVKNCVADPDLKGILEMYGINAVYLDQEDPRFFKIFREEDVYCVPFIMAFENGKRVGLLTSNIPAHSFYDELEKWYDL
jgi:hypothetical protein